MKKFRAFMTGKLHKSVAIMSIIAACFLFTSKEVRSWGAHKTILKMGGTFAVLGFVAKIKEKGITLTTEEEAHYTALDSAFSDYVKGLVTTESMNEKITGIKGLMSEAQVKQFEEMLETQVKQANLLDQLKTSGVPGNPSNAPISLKEQIKAAMLTPEAQEQIKSFQKKQPGAQLQFEIKAVGDMSVAATTARVTAGTAIAFPQPDFIPGLNDVARNKPFIIQLLNVGNTMKENLVWTEKYLPEGAAGWVAEGDEAPEVDFDIRIGESRAKMVTAYTKVSVQMLDDVDYIASEIEKEIIYQIGIKTDTDLLSGTGAGASIKGIAAYASLYTLTTVKTTTPNTCDAILAAAAQISNANFNPDIAILNPIDFANTKLLKGTTGYYLLNPNNSGDRWAGIRIVQSNQVPVGTTMVMDSSKSNVYKYGGFNITYGWVDKDFIKHQVTILGEQRLHSFVKENDKSAFVMDTIVNITTAITAV